MLDPYTIRKPGIGSSNLHVEELAKVRGQVVVCWHGGLQKNHSPNTVPLAEVMLRTLHPDNNFGSLVRQDVVISHLGSLRVGTVWKQGNLIGEIGMDRLRPQIVNFDPRSWQLVTAKSASLFESYMQQLPKRSGSSWLIQLKTASGETILVPCLEFLTRCYGRSSETARLLVTYGLKTIQDLYFYEFNPNPERLLLKLERGVSIREAPFLAHAMYDDYTRNICQSLHNKLQAEFKPGTQAFIQVSPWFKGQGQIEGQGYWIDEKTFLLLRVDGLSEPDGPPITVEYKRYTKDAAEQGTSTGRPYSRKLPPGASTVAVSITGTEAPNSKTSQTVYDPPFRTLGTKRKLHHRKKFIPGQAGRPVPGVEKDRLAPGDARGNGEGGGKSEHVSPEATPEGIVALMWQTCLSLAQSLPTYISELGWYTKAFGFQTEGVPRFEYLSFPTKKKRAPIRLPKPVLIIRMMVGGRHIYILEIHRNPRKSEDENGITKHVEDSYRGLMVELPPNGKVADIELAVIFKNIIANDCRIKNTQMSNYPHVTFVHRPKEEGCQPFGKVVLKHLRKLIGH